MPSPAALAFAARQVVDERDAPSLGVLRDHLMAEHGARCGAAELLHVGPAEPAGAHAHERPGALRLRHLRERRLPGAVESDRAHGGIVGARNAVTAAGVAGA